MPVNANRPRSWLVARSSTVGSVKGTKSSMYAVLNFEESEAQTLALSHILAKSTLKKLHLFSMEFACTRNLAKEAK